MICDKEKFQEIVDKNPIVNSVLKYGGSLEDCVYYLTQANDKLIKEIMDIKPLCPRKIRTPMGQFFVFRCPEELIPEELIPEEIN
jgi:hypothetical protein